MFLASNIFVSGGCLFFSFWYTMFLCTFYSSNCVEMWCFHIADEDIKMWVLTSSHLAWQEPLEMPWERVAVEQVQLLVLMNCCLSVRYDLSQVKAEPVMLREDSRRERRMVWLMLSKAAVRSRIMRMLRWPKSDESRRLLMTSRRAVSMLWVEENCSKELNVLHFLQGN